MFDFKKQNDKIPLFEYSLYIKTKSPCTHFCAFSKVMFERNIMSRMCTFVVTYIQ